MVPIIELGLFGVIILMKIDFNSDIFIRVPPDNDSVGVCSKVHLGELHQICTKSILKKLIFKKL